MKPTNLCAATKAKRVRHLIALLLAFIVTPSLPAALQPRAVFGPERFVRATGGTTIFTRSFVVPAYVASPYTLSIVNGGVSSASILVDGVEVVRPDELSPATATIQKPLALSAGSHALEVRLNGAPDSHLRLTISGMIPLGDLAEGRAAHSATLLVNGHVLIAGGRSAGGPIATAEMFDPSALTSSSSASRLGAARADHAASALAVPQVLVTGGTDASGTRTDAELYRGNAFQPLAAVPQISRSGHTATVLRDGRVLILGGNDASGNTLSPSEAFDPNDDSLAGAIYDPVNGSFRILPHALRVARANHTATTLPNGQVLVAGGRNADGLLSSAELFDPESGQSTLFASSLVAARSAHTATLRADGSVIFAGGRTAAGLTDTIEIFNSATQSFTHHDATLIRARADHSATLLPSGEILIAGGEASGGVTNHTELIGPPDSDSAIPATTVFPADRAIDVNLNAIVAIRFSEPIAVSSLGAEIAAAGARIDATLGVGESGLYAFLVPRTPLLSGTLYSVVLNGVRDLAGNALPATTTTFSTVQPPSITSFAPTHGLRGSEVTISGTGFDDRAPERNRVTLGGVPAVVTTATATSLTVTVPDAIAVGPHTFIVQTRGGTATSVDAFIVDHPAPVLASIAPFEASVGNGAITLIAAGSSFVNGAIVVFAGTPLATTYVSDTQLTAIAPSTLFTAAGIVAVSVVNPAPGGGTSNSVPFEVRASNGAIGDLVWHDLDVDGIRDSEEPGLPNVAVKLHTDAGSVVAETMTDANGAYRFSNVAPGAYRVEFTAPVSFAFVAPVNGLTDVFQLAAAQELLTIDAALFRPPTAMVSSPLHGETDVAVTRETIFRFSNPLASSSIPSSTLFASFGGIELATRIHVSPDRRTVTLFYNQDLPASARIRVTLVGDELRDEFGRSLENTRVDFDTLTLSTVAGTRVCGRVFASELGAANVPLAGVVVSVDGMETTLRVVTDNLGNFCLDPAPAGKFFVHIDGRTATNPLPAGDYYPVVGKLWESTAGETVNIGEIYLPRVISGTLQPVSRTSDTTITFPAAVLAQFPNFAGATITVPADSLFSDSGARGGMVGIAPVPPDRIPGPLPNGLELPLVITVQTDGASNFDRPVPVCLPNVPDHTTYTPYAPGELTELYSFNHDTGQWEAVGPMHVTADGKLVCSDPGFGILAPGWHGTQPPPRRPLKPPPEPPFPCKPPNDVNKLNDCVREAGKPCLEICLPLLWQCARLNVYACLFSNAAVAYCMYNCTLGFYRDACRCKGRFCAEGCGIPGLATIRTTATPDDIAQQLAGIGRQISTLLYPYALNGLPIPADVTAQIEALEAQANAVAGGDAVAWLRADLAGREADLQPIEAQVGDASFDAPPYPVHYVAVVGRPTGNMFLRGQTLPYGQYTLFIPRNGNLVFVAFYDPLTKTYGVVLPRVTSTTLPHLSMGPIGTAELDSDHDGLIDMVELVYGTDAADPDSDDDGIFDGAEVDQGTNPLDGLPTRTGVIATAPTPADALDVCAMNNLAAVATGPAGVSVFNVFNGMSPTIIAQVDTPGSGQAVACGGDRIVVADGPRGLAVIDITDPPAARIVHQIAVNGTAQGVVVSAGIAYVATDAGRLVAIDLASGTILQEVAGLANVHDVAIEGDTLFVATSNELRAYSLTSGSLEFTGKIALFSFPEGITNRRRLFVGGGTAYVTSYPGYDTFDVSDRTALVRTGSAIDGGPNSFKQIVANGSGLGIAAVGVNPQTNVPHDVWLYDVSDPAVTNAFLTILTTPGLTRAVSIYNGLAYAADGASGLQVINYLPYDALGQAPTIQLETNYPAGVAEEGKVLRMTAVVDDDVQVRNVQFIVDGKVAVTDGNFPFEHRFITPLLSQQASFTMSACATDTGGNRTCTAEALINLVEDITPPRVTAVTPANNSGVAVGTISAISATFSEPIDEATLNARFQLFRAGPDGLTGTADDVAVTGGAVSYREEIKSAFLTFSASLPIDRYRAVLSAAVADLKGNPIGADTVWTFRVKAPNLWTNPAGGAFNVASNWSDGIVPDATDVALITLPGNYTVTVTHNAAAQRLVIGGVNSTPTVWVRGGNAGGHVTLTVADTLENQGLIRLESIDGGWISNLAVTNGAFMNRGTIEVNTGTGGGRAIAGALNNSGSVNINRITTFDGTLTNTGTITVASGLKLLFSAGDVLNANAGTITGVGLVELNGSVLNVNGGTTTGTIPSLINSAINYNPAVTSASTYHLTGSASTISGSMPPSQTLWIRGSDAGGHTTVSAIAGFVNNGTIRIESIDGGWISGISIPAGVMTNRALIETKMGAGGSRVISGTFLNEGIVRVDRHVTLSGTWTNRNAINVASGQTLSVTGAATVFHQLAGAIHVDGIFDMSLGTFNFNGGSIAAPGQMRFGGSTFNFRGGTTSGNAVLVANGTLLYDSTSSPAVFAASGPTQVNGAIATGQTLWISGRDIGGHATVTLTNGVTNAGTIRLESIDGGWQSHLTGNFTNQSGGVVETFAGTGGSRLISGAIENQGTLSINIATTLNGTFTNSGAVSVAANQRLIHNGANAVFIHNGGAFALTGAYELYSGRLDFNGGTTPGARLPLLINSRIRFGASSDAATFILTGPGQAEGTINAGQTLWVRGQDLGGHTTVTASPSLINEGTIRIESADGGWQSFLVGDVTNRGTVESNAGTGGGRQLSGTFRNEGTLLVRRGTSYNGTLTNRGTIDIASGHKLTNANASSLFVQSGGTVSGAGLLEISSGATLQYDGGTTTGLPPQLVNANLIFGSSSDPALFVMSGGGVVSGHIAPAQTLWVRGQDLGGHTTITAAAGLVNDGTIRLESADGGYQSNLNIPSGVLTNRALIETRTGSSGSRLLSGAVINDGTVQASHHLGITGTFTNRSTINVVAGKTLSVTGAATVFDQVAGSINIDGLVDMSAPTFNFDGGTIAAPGQMQLAGGAFNFRGGMTSGNILLVNSNLLCASATSPALFAASGATQVSGTLAAGQTLWVSGRNHGGHSTIQLANGFTSAGTIRLESRDGGWESSVAIPAGSASSTGLVEILSGTGGARVISGAFLNAGTLSAGRNMTHSGTLTNTGTIDILAGVKLIVTPTFHHNGGTITNAGAFEMNGGTFNLNGGGTSGNAPLLINGTTVFGNAGANALLMITGATPGISGDIKAGQSIWVAGSDAGGHTTLTAASGFTSRGNIRIESRDGGWTTNMTITSGTLVNEGRVDVNQGSGGSRTLTMNVDNRGVFAVNRPVTVSGTFDNAAGGTVSGTATMTLSVAANALTNHGTLSPGNSPGTLTVNRVAQASDGSLAIEIGSTAFDQLSVPGNVTLDGTLNVTLLDGFVPSIGASYVIVTTGSRTGTFATTNGLAIGSGRKFDVSYGTDKVTLTVVPE